MSLSLPELEEFLATHRQVVLVEILRALGSTPRDKGAFMLISGKDMAGTIGGGQLEYIALDNARRMLRDDDKERQLDIALGPLIGQCCGGHVTLGLRRVNKAIAEKLRRIVADQVAQYRHVYIMGAGHVGRALAQALALLPVKTIVVDTRKDALNGLPQTVETRLSALPEGEVRAAPQGSAFVVLTHDHALDFLIAREALLRCDACYVGMIGSRSKRATFASWLEDEGQAPEDIKRLICPIGGDKVNDKRPEIIAALVVAEILLHTQRQQSGRKAVDEGISGVKRWERGRKIGVK